MHFTIVAQWTRLDEFPVYAVTFTVTFSVNSMSLFHLYLPLATSHSLHTSISLPLFTSGNFSFFHLSSTLFVLLQSPALRYHNFRRKKRPWSMHNIPPTTPQSDSSEEPSPSTQLPQGRGIGNEKGNGFMYS